MRRNNNYVGKGPTGFQTRIQRLPRSSSMSQPCRLLNSKWIYTKLQTKSCLQLFFLLLLPISKFWRVNDHPPITSFNHGAWYTHKSIFLPLFFLVTKIRSFFFFFFIFSTLLSLFETRLVAFGLANAILLFPSSSCMFAEKEGRLSCQDYDQVWDQTWVKCALAFPLLEKLLLLVLKS